MRPDGPKRSRTSAGVGRVRIQAAPAFEARNAPPDPFLESEGSLRVLFTGPAPNAAGIVGRLPPDIELVPHVWPCEPDDVIKSGANVVLGACERLDVRTASWIMKLSRDGLPVLLVVDEDPAERATLRGKVRELGGLDVIIRREIDDALLDLVFDRLRARNRYERELTDLRSRFALAIAGSKDGMWEWDLRDDAVFFSQRWLELLGYEQSDVAPNIDGWLSRVHPQDVDRVRRDLDAALGGRATVHQIEHRVRAKNGKFRWVLSRGVVARNAAGDPVRMSGSLSDVTQYRDQERNLREQSRHDAVTDLPRRDVFLERLARALELAGQYDDYAYAVLVVEVDRIGIIRDSLGHQAADEALALVARRLEACLRPDDLLARFSNDQFAILLEDLADPSQGTHIAERMHHAIKEPFEIGGQTVYTTVSIGMTSSARSYESVDDLITDVTAAVHRASTGGRDRHEMYNTSMRIEALTLLRLEMALREAIENRELLLHYQPQIDLASRQLIGFEALLRWHHPQRGLVPPGEFIPVAEDTGLIVPIGRWAIREATEQLQAWHDEFKPGSPFSVAVNLSGKQAGDPHLLPAVESALRDTGLPPRCLKIELTESVVMENADQVMNLFNGFRDYGVNIYVDDFGTGYSSLSYLHRFPVDGLKIDKSFVDDLDGTAESTTMVRTIMDLATNLGMDVVAEGIEEEVQAKQLIDLGCRNGQGYLFSRPLPPTEIRDKLAKDGD